MKIEKIKNKLLRHKRGIALGMSVLFAGMTVAPYLSDIITYAISGDGIITGTDNKYWNKAMGKYPGNYYGKEGRSYFGKLEVNGRASICLDSNKKLNRTKTGTIAEYLFDGTTSFPTGISRDGAEMLAYAMIMGGGGNGKEITADNYYILCQCLCWMIESKGGEVTWEDLEEWEIETTKLADYLLPPYNKSVKGAIKQYCDNATRQLRPEAVAEFMSKYPSEAPVLELKYNEDTGIWENDFELIDYLDALDKGFDQVWMQYFLDYDTAIEKIGMKDKLSMVHKADGGRNWVHVEFKGDIEELKAVGPIPLEYAEGDGRANTFGLQNLSIWTPQDSAQQHLLADVAYGPWTVYMTFGGIPPEWEPTPGSYEVIVNTHQHDETFISDYNIEVYKYDFETGKPLANSEFEILEKMDTSQFDDSVDHNGGNPDGTYPLDDLNFDKFKKIRDNTEKPTDDWQVCGT